MMIFGVVTSKHTPALRATPLHRRDPDHACEDPLYEEGCPKGGVCRAVAISLLVLFCGCFPLAGCRTPDSSLPTQPLVARFFLEVRPAAPGLSVQLPVSQVRVNVNPKPVFVEHDIANVEVAKVDLGRCLYFQLSPAAARDLHRLGAANLGRRLVLTLNDAPAGVRVLDQAITDGSLLIFVERPENELPALAERLKRTVIMLDLKGR